MSSNGSIIELDALCEDFERRCNQVPATPEPVDEAEFLSHYGTVAYELSRRQQRSAELRGEWEQLAASHVQLHHQGLCHLKHLHEQSQDISCEIERLRRFVDDTQPARRLFARIATRLSHLGYNWWWQKHE